MTYLDRMEDIDFRQRESEREPPHPDHAICPQCDGEVEDLGRFWYCRPCDRHWTSAECDLPHFPENEPRIT